MKVLHLICLLFWIATLNLRAGTTSELPNLADSLIKTVLEGEKNDIRRELESRFSINQLFQIPALGSHSTMTLLGFAASVGNSNAVVNLLELGADPFVPIHADNGCVDLPIDVCYDYRNEQSSLDCIAPLATVMKQNNIDVSTNLWKSALVRLVDTSFSTNTNVLVVCREVSLVRNRISWDGVITNGNTFVNMSGVPLTSSTYEEVQRCIREQITGILRNVNPCPRMVNFKEFANDESVLVNGKPVVIIDSLSLDSIVSCCPVVSVLIAFGEIRDQSMICITEVVERYFVRCDDVYISTRFP